jgi:hypothetical protein
VYWVHFFQYQSAKKQVKRKKVTGRKRTENQGSFATKFMSIGNSGFFFKELKASLCSIFPFVGPTGGHQIPAQHRGTRVMPGDVVMIEFARSVHIQWLRIIDGPIEVIPG